MNIYWRTKYFLLCVFYVSVCGNVYADIVKTKDGQVLNGKIVLQSNSEVVFANKDNTSVIKKEEILEIYKTNSPDEDEIMLKRMGFSKNRNEIETNYNAGEQKLEQYLLAGNIGIIKKKKIELSIYGNICKNYLELGNAIPYGYIFGFTIGRETGFDSKNWFYPDSIVADASVYISNKNARSLYGGSLMGGVSWDYSVSMFKLFVAPMGGGSIFMVNDGDSVINTYSFNVSLDLGIKAYFGSFFTGVSEKTFYVYDKNLPLLNTGINFLVGYSW